MFKENEIDLPPEEFITVYEVLRNALIQESGIENADLEGQQLVDHCLRALSGESKRKQIDFQYGFLPLYSRLHASKLKGQPYRVSFLP